MHDSKTTRRKFLVAVLTLGGTAATVPFLRSSQAWAESDTDMPAVMVKLARRLFPHEGMADAVYGEVVGQVLATIASNPATAGLIDGATQVLDAASSGSWIDLAESEQLQVLRATENDPTVAGLRETVRFVFYQNESVWKHIDYPGSSREYGGYIKRGFNDIDWLPEAE
jgi:hypothetical protein